MNKHGLVLGKFMPLTNGHIHLIESALKSCERLTVLLCSLRDEPIDGALRFDWLRETFPHHEYSKLRLIHVTDEVPSFPHQHADFWNIWRELILRNAPDVDALFTSEESGERLANEIGARHICVDLGREKVPISATQIRDEPLRNWHFIPRAVRPSYAKRILVCGPESTGKTTLCRQLAEHFQTVWVPEYARDFYNSKRIENAEFNDVLSIAADQQEAEETAARDANRLLFCDTDAITTVIYSRHYYGQVPAWLLKISHTRRYDLVLFCEIDLPWEADTQRDLGHMREEVRRRFVEELQSRRIDFVTIRGQGNARLQTAIAAVENAFSDLRT